MSVCWLRKPPKSWERWDAIRWRPRNLWAKPASTNPHFSRRLTWKPWSECRQLQKFAFGVAPPFVKNCTLTREPEVTTAPELLYGRLAGQPCSDLGFVERESARPGYKTNCPRNL